MKKWFLVLLAVFFTGCSTKTVYLPLIEKPDAVRNTDIRHLKVENIKNDSINLKNSILSQIEKTDEIIPGYFIYQNPKTVLTGTVFQNRSQKIYLKTVPVYIKGPACVYLFYPCKSVNGQVFCKNTSAFTLTPDKYGKISKNLYKNKNFVIYNNNIYKIIKSCRPVKETIECEKKEITVYAFITVKNLNGKILFSKNYSYSDTDDPCSDINLYEGRKYYKAYKNFDLNEISQTLAEEIISDIAPHEKFVSTDFYEDPDIDLTKKDKKIFTEIINDSYPLSTQISYMKLLYKKYPGSCVISYDLTIFYIKQKDYTSARFLLKQIQKNKKCGSNIMESAYEVLIYLLDTYDN